MATPSQAVLKANAIVVSEKTNKLFCSICNFDYNCTDWTSHIEKGAHVATLERFNENFENLEENACCKTCKAEIEWDMIRAHGKLHMFVPWYEPDDKYKIFYENHMLKFRTSYHCCLCDEIFQEWSTAYNHIFDSKHQNVVQQIRQSVPTTGSKKFYGGLISAGFVPGVDGTVECQFCNKIEPGYHATDEHIKGPNHARNKSKCVDKLLKRMENENSSKSKNAAPSKPVESRAWAKIPPVESVADLASRRMICNFFLEPNAAEETSNRKKEEKKMPEAAKPSNTLEKVFDNCQDFIVDYVVRAGHPLCEEARAKPARSKRGKIAKPPKDDTDPYCLICRCPIPGYLAIKDHVKGVRHATSREKYRCEDILVVEGTPYYYCRSCDLTVTDFVNVYRHVIDDSHTKSTDPATAVPGEEKVSRKLRKAPKKIANGMEITREGEKSKDSARFVSDEEKVHQKLRKAPEKIANGMEIPRQAENSVSQNDCMYVVRRNAKKSFCQICDETPYPVKSKNLKEHIAGERHKLALIRYGCDNIVALASAYHCRCCDLELADLENVCLHVKDKRHTSSMIKVARTEEPRAPKRARDKFESQSCSDDPVRQQSCGILLGDYIAVQIPSCSSNDLNEPAKDAPANDVFHGQSFYRSLNPNSFELPTQPRQFQQSNRNNGVPGVDEANRFWKFPSHVETARHPSETTSYRSMLATSDAQPQAGATYTNWLRDVEASGRPDRGYWSATSGQPELNSLRSSMASELSRFLEFSEMNEAKNVPRPRFDERTRKPLNVVQAKKIRCNLCARSFFDSMQLHVHMASHFTEEFARPRNCCTNGAMENDSENDRNLPNRTESPEFGSAANGDVLYSNGDEATNSGNAGQDIEGEFARQKTATEDDDGAAKHSPKKVNLKHVIDLLDFDEDYIYELSEKLADVETGIRLCLTVDSNNIYCLICQKTVQNTVKNYLEHLSSVDHCEYLEMMENDWELFRDVPNQISDMDLAHEYMQEMSDDSVHCFICDRETANDEPSIEEHIYDETHESRCAEMRERAMRNFEDIKQLIQCDWYRVQKYWCVVCELRTASEAYFVKHLASRKHKSVLRLPENGGKKMIYDFCAACGVLWYGYRCSYAYHSDIESHKWMARDGYYLSPELPKFARSLLAKPEEFVENKIKCLDENHESERAKEETLIRDMESAVRMKFPCAKAYTYGSRASGLGSPDSDIDVYLDRGKTYDGNAMSESQTAYFMTGVHRCLIEDAQTWDVEEKLTNCRSPIIRAHHRATGLNCDISFQNGLSVENTKLIKTLNNVFPMCRKLILFLKQWTAYCDLDGSKGISSYALYWYVIFYLQKESILPSIAMIISMSKKSHIIAGWEVSFSQDFTYNTLESNYSTKEFLTKFFKFYANFDFRYNVASPLLGKELEKRDFVEPEKLPKEMALYVDYMRNTKKKPEPFRIDSAMCIQDPIDLQHNLTKAVSKVYLNRFRTYCSKSLDVLCST